MKIKIISLSIVFITLLTIFMCPITNAVGNIITVGSLTAKPLMPEDRIKVIIGTIKWIGYVVAIGMLIWIGIKYVLSGASERAKVKETLVPLLIGAILVVAGVEITAAVFGVFE